MRMKAKPSKPERKKNKVFIFQDVSFNLSTLMKEIPSDVDFEDIHICVNYVGYEDGFNDHPQVEVYYEKLEDEDKYEKRLDAYKGKLAVWEKWREDNKLEIEEVMKLRAEKTLATAQIRLDKEKKRLEKDLKELDKKKKKLGI